MNLNWSSFLAGFFVLHVVRKLQHEIIFIWCMQRCRKRMGRVGNCLPSFLADYTANIYRMVIGNFIGNPLSAFKGILSIRIIPIGKIL